jgi:hypothetical protein
MLPYRGPKKVIEMLTPSKTMISQAESNTNWKGLYRVGGVAALIQVVLMPIQIIVLFAWPPPTTVTGYVTLFENNRLLGLLSLDLLLEFVFGVNDLSFIVPILGLCVLSAFGPLLLTALPDLRPTFSGRPVYTKHLR